MSFAGGTAEDVLQGVRTHLRHGTTTVVASAVTGDLDFLARHAGMLAELAQQGDIAGIHFEGPFISPCRKGAHDDEPAARPRPGGGPQADRRGPRPRPDDDAGHRTPPAAWTPYGCSSSTA